MSDEVILLERDGPVAVVRMNRPEKHNAMNRELSLALTDTFEALDADESVAAIVLTGAGDKAFCAGADMAERTAGPAAAMQSVPARPVDPFGAVGRTGKPVIGAINGYAYGGGALLATRCDIRLASERATFRFVGATYGLVVGGVQLPQIVGPAHAKELLFTARVIDAAEALRIGLVNHVYPHDELLGAAVEMAKQIAGNSAAAVRWAKKVVDAATVIEKGLEVEAEANRATRGTSEQTARFAEAARRVTGGGQ